MTDEWDRQIEADVKAGRLDKLGKQALEDYQIGNTRTMWATKRHDFDVAQLALRFLYYYCQKALGVDTVEFCDMNMCSYFSSYVIDIRCKLVSDKLIGSATPPPREYETMIDKSLGLIIRVYGIKVIHDGRAWLFKLKCKEHPVILEE